MAGGERKKYSAGNQSLHKFQNLSGCPDRGKLIHIIKTSGEAVCLVAPGGSVLSVSNSAADLFGYSSLGFRKQHIRNFFEPADVIQFPVNGSEAVPVFSSNICTGITKKRTGFRVQVTVSTVWDTDGNVFYTLLFSNLSMLVKLEEEWDLLMRNTDEPFILIDRKLVILSFNEQLRRLYHAIRQREIHRGDCILDHALPERKTFLRSMYKRVLAGEEVRDEIERLLYGRELHHYTVLYRPAVNAHGMIEGIFIIIREKALGKEQ